jgi:Domain of unknown function (DUF4112)
VGGPARSCVYRLSSHVSCMTSTRAWNFEDRPPHEVYRAQRLARLDALATLMDTAVVVPGTNIRFGVDAIVGLVPGIGDLITSLVSLYIVHEAHQLGAPKHLILRMIWNVAIDGVVGAAPLVGDVFDVLWRANKRNMALLRDHLGERGEFAQPITIPKV